MSNIERNFVLDNGTVKDNISYNPKYYVTGDNTEDYRRIGDIPVTGNYEPNLPYPLDARTLVPKVEYLTDTSWWRTAFGVDTVLYKGMLVTCIENHIIYVYDGPTVKLSAGTIISSEDWKKQRIDKSLVKWPIDVDENEIIRIGVDIENPYKNTLGVYITNSSNLNGPSFYISDEFISLGSNKSVVDAEDELTLPFIPYDIVDLFSDKYTDTQTGIFIPTSIDDTEIPMSIYSARGINIRGALMGEGTINLIKLDRDGNLTNFATTDINLNASNNLNANVGTSLQLNVSTNIEANIDNNIVINAVGETTKFSRDRYLETSANLVNSSTFTLNTLKDVSINATGQIYVNYAAGVKIFGNTNNSILNITPTSIEAKAVTNISINSSDGNITLSAKNGRARIDSSALDVSAKNLANIKAKEFLVNADKFGFNYNTNPETNKYTKIDGSAGFLTLAAKGINGESKIVLETGEPGSDGRIINITSNLINLNSVKGTTNINTANFYVKSNDNTLISVEDGSVNIGLNNTSVYINKMCFPSADTQIEGVLRLTKNRQLLWSKDIGVHHANELNSDENDIANAWIRLATIHWEKDTDGTPKAQSEAIIMSISDNQNAEIFMVKVNCVDGAYTADVQRLSYFSDMSLYHEISVVQRTTGEYIDIFVKAFSNQFAWNALSYSSNCVITETLKLPYDRETLQPKTITTVNYKETIFNPNNYTSKLTKNSLIIPWPNDSSVGKNKSAFLRYTRAANDTGGWLDWGNLDNQLKDIANNDAGTKVYIIGTERTGAAVSTCNEFYNNARVYIDQYCNIFATAFYATSDIRKKKDIKEIDVNRGLTLIPKEYRFIDSNKKAYGFIAQEVEDAGYADIVNIDKDTGDKTLDYNSAFAIALAQMQAKIKQLEDEIKELKNK